MRLDWLRIPNYRNRNLRNFEINFDEAQSTTVLIGRNGSGKSNLIEAVVEIFRNLEMGNAPAFAYELRYICREQTIELNADPDRGNKRLEVRVDGNAVTQAAFKPTFRRLLLVSRCVCNFRLLKPLKPRWLRFEIQGQPEFRNIKHVTRRGIYSNPEILVEYRSQLLPLGTHIGNILSTHGM